MGYPIFRRQEAVMGNMKNDRGSKALIQWRHRMKYTQKEAWWALGVSRSGYQIWEAGHRFDKPSEPVAVPKSILLACSALEEGLAPIAEDETNR